MNRGQLLAALIWFGVGLAIAIGAHRLGLGALNSPGPGLFAFVIGVGIAGLALSVAVSAARTAPASATVIWPERAGCRTHCGRRACFLHADARAPRLCREHVPVPACFARHFGPCELGGDRSGQRRSHFWLLRGLREVAEDHAAGWRVWVVANGHARPPVARLQRYAATAQSLLLLPRRFRRYAGRRAAGPWPAIGHRTSAAGGGLPGAGHGHHHAGGRLLRLHVRRIDNLHSRQHSRRRRLRRHMHRRSSDGAAGAGRACLGHCRVRLLHCRHVWI